MLGRNGAYAAGPGLNEAWAPGEVPSRVGEVSESVGPRWVVWSADSALRSVVAARIDVTRTWDLAEAHRLLHGGWWATPSHVWAACRGLPSTDVPLPRRARDAAFDGDLFDAAQLEADGPLTPPGHLRAAVLDGAAPPERLRLVAEMALDCQRAQEQSLVHRSGDASQRLIRAVWSESAAAVLCLELERDGLPVDRLAAEDLISASAGPRPQDDTEAALIRAQRDRAVLRHAPGREGTDLRNPAQVRSLLQSVGVDVPNTRAWVLEPYRHAHPLVDALLTWRKDERVATTYGYRWLDENVGPDDRLRGAWTACDGAAGRMTAQNGLHNLPVPLRPAIRAAAGHVFVRADLGQIEPRVLAVVSGDRAFAEATRSDDLYAPVAAKLGVDRAIAKVAVLAAMYGQRSGAAGEALKDLERAYPVAMGLLDRAYADGVARRPLRTYGGRLIRFAASQEPEAPADPTRTGPLPPASTAGPTTAGPTTAGPTTAGPTTAGGAGSAGSGPSGIRPMSAASDAARGRFARNAVIQGSAAELFKAWAATVRHAVRPLGGQIVLCLHDELLVHVPEPAAQAARQAVEQSLVSAARTWAETDQVRFVADTGIIRRWSEAKG